LITNELDNKNKKIKIRNIFKNDTFDTDYLSHNNELDTLLDNFDEKIMDEYTNDNIKDDDIFNSVKYNFINTNINVTCILNKMENN
jgi:hypothetical protein